MPRYVDGERCYSYDEVADLLKITPTQAMQMGMTGKLKKGPRSGFITKSSLVDYAEEKQLAAQLKKPSPAAAAKAAEAARQADIDARVAKALEDDAE